jgi:hypothetical protein
MLNVNNESSSEGYLFHPLIESEGTE